MILHEMQNLGEGKVKMRSDRWRNVTHLNHPDDVVTLAFSPDGSRVLAGADDKAVVVWEVASGSQKLVMKMGAPVKAVAYSPSGRFIAAGDEDSFVNLWNADT